MNQLHIKSRLGDYDVFFEENFSFLEKLGSIKNQLLIVDRNVYNLYKDVIATNFENENPFLFDALEEKKNLEYVKEIYEHMIRRQTKRNITIISIGGGITQDVTGFVASTLYRGVSWIFVPTTFLAQTDSCIGSKTSLNFQSFKNLIGTFYPPSQIYINTKFLYTLTKDDFFSGIGEAIKLQLMKEIYPKDINAIVNVIERCKKNMEFALDLIHDGLKVKISYMENDEFDHGRRNLLNYGHCFGHALETTSDYYVSHGIAINIGMIFANALSLRRGMLKEDLFRKVTNKLNVCNIPINLREEHFEHDMLLSCMKNDKKRVGKDLTVIIPDNEFRLFKVDNVTEEEFFSTLDYIKNLLFKSVTR
jgi:3-dehydroquinate synthase